MAACPPGEPDRARSASIAFVTASAAALAGIVLLFATVSRVAGIVLLAAAVALAVPAISQRRQEPGADAVRRDAQRQVLQTQLEATQQAEQRAEQDLQKRADAAQSVTQALVACELTAPTPAAAAAALEQWLTRHQDYLGQLASAQRGWAELQALLNGHTLDSCMKVPTAQLIEPATSGWWQTQPCWPPSPRPLPPGTSLTYVRRHARPEEQQPVPPATCNGSP